MANKIKITIENTETHKLSYFDELSEEVGQAILTLLEKIVIQEEGSYYIGKQHACCYWLPDVGCSLGKKSCPDSYDCDSFD